MSINITITITKKILLIDIAVMKNLALGESLRSEKNSISTDLFFRVILLETLIKHIK